jgi:signal transduction histidine kinase
MARSKKISFATILDTVRSRAFYVGIRMIFILIVSNLLLMAMFYGYSTYRFYSNTALDFQREFATIKSEFDRLGLEAVVEHLDAIDSGKKRHRFAYMLLDKNNNKLVGQLNPESKYIDMSLGWFKTRFSDYYVLGERVRRDYLSDHIMLPGDYRLVLAVYTGDKKRLFLGAVDYFLLSVVITLTFSFFMIYLNSSGFLRRLELVNNDIDVIMAGDLSHRLKLRGDTSEVDKLVGHINEMLDRIQELLIGVKQVSDNIAHDLRTPLTRLRNNLASFERRMEGESQERVRELIAESDHIISTFNSLLRIARIELGEISQQREKVKLNELVYEVVELYEPVASDKTISISTELSSVSIFAERNLIFQAIANVVDNAIKYTPVNGQIKVSLIEADNREAVLTIVDSGCGIKQENRSKVFDRFFREDSSRGQEPGNGLGLSLVAAVVKIHDADITLEDGDPGLSVRLTFPKCR